MVRGTRPFSSRQGHGERDIWQEKKFIIVVNLITIEFFIFLFVSHYPGININDNVI